MQNTQGDTLRPLPNYTDDQAFLYARGAEENAMDMAGQHLAGLAVPMEESPMSMWRRIQFERARYFTRRVILGLEAMRQDAIFAHIQHPEDRITYGMALLEECA